MKIAISIAMEKELALIETILKGAKHCGEYITGKIDDNDVVIYLSGIGKVSAAIKATECINQFNPDWIISTGVSGGIDSKLKIGDIVIGTKYAYHDVWCGKPNAIGQVQGLPAIFESKFKSAEQCAGLIVCGDQFITETDKLLTIKQNFPTALAVDMESAAIAQVCHVKNKNFVALRILSDVVGDKEQVENYHNFWDKAPNLLAEKLLDIVAKL